MNSVLNLVLLISSLLLFFIVSYFVCKKKLLVKYALLWFLISLTLIIISIFTEIPVFFANLLGFEITSNFIFFILIGLVIIISFSFSLSISKINKRILLLTQIVAIDEWSKRNGKEVDYEK